MHAQKPRSKVGVIGASGYAGIEALKLVARHPDLSLELVSSDRLCGKAVESVTALSGAAGRLLFYRDEVAPSTTRAVSTP